LRVTHPSKQYGKLTVDYWIGSDGKTYFNSSANIFVDLGKQKETVKIFQASSSNDEICTHLYLQSSVDMCKAVKGIITNPLMRTFFDGFLKGVDQKLPGEYFFIILKIQ
jgi:hypothetical protein